MVGGDSKIVLTRTHTRVPVHTHNSYLETKKEIKTWHAPRQMGVKIKEKENTFFLSFLAKFSK